jgi:hypothetical protein
MFIPRYIFEIDRSYFVIFRPPTFCKFAEGSAASLCWKLRAELGANFAETAVPDEA